MQYHTIIQSFSHISENMNAIIAAGGYPFLILSVFLEGLPLIGTVVPGHIAIIAAGFLAHAGIMSLTWVIVLSLIAAIAGDAMGYHLGRKYGLSLIDKIKPYFFIKDEHIEKAQDLLTRHTGKAMIIGRMSPITRALMPFLVGAGGTGKRKFWIYNLIGAVIWVGSSIAIGYVFGYGYHAAAGYFGKAIVVAIVFAVIIAWGYRFANARYNMFRRYELFALILNLISLTVLGLMVRDAWIAQSFMANLDIWVNGFVFDHSSSASAFIGKLVSDVISVTTVTGAAIIIGGIFIYLRKWRSAAVMLLSVGSAVCALVLMKEFFLRARPDNALVYLTDPSFPSGHATMAAAFFFVCAYLFGSKMKGWIARETLVAVCAIAVFVVGIARILLNVHWASDVIAGWALGVFCASGSVLLVKYVSTLIVPKKKRKK